MNTKRQHDIKVRMSDSEYAQFCAAVEEAGTSQQMYGLDALLGAQITSKEELDLLVQLNEQMADLTRIDRGIGTNINQIARMVNSNREADAEDIQRLLIEHQTNQKERERLWQSIRALVPRVRHMHH